MAVMGKQLDVARCPHCSIANPRLYHVWGTNDGEGTPRSDGESLKAWALYLCSSCGSCVTARSHTNRQNQFADEIFPSPKQAHGDIPDVARAFLQQAFEVLHAPDAAAVMAGSAVDAMLKDKGYVEGSLYTRIDEAKEAALLTQGMADWAHSVRLGSNRPRHADAERPHVSYEEARQSVEFAEALGNFMFVLTAKIQRGIEAAENAEAVAQ